MDGSPITIAVINMKGGVGKSTITALLARYATYKLGLDVLVVDLDPQANLSQALMHNRYQGFLNKKDPSIVEVFNGYQPPSHNKKSPQSLDINAAVVNIDSENNLQLIPSRFDFSDNLISSLKPDTKILARYLSENFNDKDVIFIDCAPTESVLTQAAYHASGLILVPVKPEYFATIGFPLLQESVNQFRAKNRGHDINILGVVINNAFYHGGNDGGPEKTRALRDIRTEANSNGWKIFKSEIPHSRGFPKMMRGDYSYSGNAPRFNIFAAEFFESINLNN